MSKLAKVNFSCEEDYVIQCECEECGSVYEEEVTECEECGSENIINTTSHEDENCSYCDSIIGMWEDAYTDGSQLICTNCYEELEEE